MLTVFKKEYKKVDINTVIHKFISADRLHRTLIEKQVAKGSLHRTQHRLLLHIYKSEEPLSQKELASFFEVSPAAIAVSVKKLEKGGYIKREALKDDMRFNKITVTDKGKEILFKTKALVDEVDTHMFKDFSEKELLLFYNCLEKMQKNLNDFEQEEVKKDETMV
ncbi:MAG: MarR family transcriptional regulator [Clostridiales bacterium]|nr:MarR family transcriptional regulator [Clostridiales bacterium]